ncbi:MAG: 30S ribosome-binding factor RbfA [Chloroflexota bacterium]|nr:30S ribosome-binding factor RbfA [Chloroflexota bacterium]
MNEHRLERANSFIKEELTIILRNAVADPRLQGVSITDVQLTPDRHVAQVYVTSYLSQEALEQAMPALEKAKGFFRGQLSQLLDWRFTPEIRFHADRSWQRGQRIDTILQEIAEERARQNSKGE